MNHFELFGLPVQYPLDSAHLASQFRDLQRQYHPDKFSTASERDRLLAVQKAAQINDAYQVLKDPVSRLEYLLFLNGTDMSNEQTTMQDPVFLMEQMEMRETLEEIDNEDALFDFDNKVSKMHSQYLQNAQQALSEQNWELTATQIRKLKFIVKLKKEIERVEDRMVG